MSATPELLLAARRCDQCLTTRNRIVSGARAAEIVRQCRATDNHFFCHKGTAAGLQVHCRGVHDINPGLAYRLGVAIGVPVRAVDPEAL